MSRDEAIAKAEEALGFKTNQPGAQSIEARKFVDMAAALGVLKLDEPVPIVARWNMVCRSYGLSEGECYGMKNMLKINGINLVEK